MQVQPLLDRVLVKRDEQDKKTQGGIIIPDTVENPPLQGEVIAVGTGAILPDGSMRELDIRTGDRVLFSKYAGTEIDIDGEMHIMLGENDVLARFDGKAVEPLLSRVLVDRDAAKDKTAGGIIIPDQAKEPPLRGTVLRVGSGALLQDGKKRKLDLEPGDRVLFNTMAGTEVEVGGEKFLLLSEAEVHAKIHDGHEAQEGR